MKKLSFVLENRDRESLWFYWFMTRQNRIESHFSLLELSQDLHRLAQTLDDDHVGTNRVGRDAASGVIDYWSLSVCLFVCFTFSLFLLIER